MKFYICILYIEYCIYGFIYVLNCIDIHISVAFELVLRCAVFKVFCSAFQWFVFERRVPFPMLSNASEATTQLAVWRTEQLSPWLHGQRPLVGFGLGIRWLKRPQATQERWQFFCTFRAGCAGRAPQLLKSIMVFCRHLAQVQNRTIWYNLCIFVPYGKRQNHKR